jgi:hypothetical protein
MTVGALRPVLAGTVPLLFGRHPDRPAPAHVLNGFVAASLGVSSIERDVRALLVPEADVPEAFSFLRESEWARDDGAFARFREDLSTIFNPDRRLWEKFGSPVPVHSLLASADVSDDGYGALVWELVRRHVDEQSLLSDLAQLLSPQEADDPVSAVAQVLVSGAEVVRTRVRAVDNRAWFAEQGTSAGRYLAKELARLVEAMSRPDSGHHRLMQIQHLARTVYLCTFVSLLLGPIAASRDSDVSSAVDLAPLVVWGGTPPGPSMHPMVIASARSFQKTVDANHQALVRLLATTLSGVRIASATPPTQRRRSLLRQALVDGGASATQADRAIEQLESAGVPLGQGDASSPAWVRRLVDEAYSTSELSKALRTTGRKLGIVAPDRGAGAPRFVVETPLLASLVAALCPAETLPFQDFVDTARDRLGLIFGPGSLEQLPVRDLWESSGIARQQLRDNQEMLRVRLVRAGLATEYSDGHTEVGFA